MNVKDLRFIVRQQRASRFFSICDEYWVTDEIVDEAITALDPVMRDRLELLKGVSRRDYGQLALPKIAGGFMKAGSSNTSAGAKAALWSLRRAILQLEKKAKLGMAGRQVPGELVCPYCKAELKIRLTVEERE